MVAGECKHVTGVLDRIAVWAASVEEVWIASAAGVRDTPDLAAEEPESLCRREGLKAGALVVWAARVDRRPAVEVLLASGCELGRVAVVFVEVAEVCTAAFAGGMEEFERCVKNFWRRPRWCSPSSWRY